MSRFLSRRLWSVLGAGALAAFTVTAPVGAETPRPAVPPVGHIAVESSPSRLPDGYFSGPLLVAADNGAPPVVVGQLRIQIVHGFVVSAFAAADSDEGTIELRPMTAADDPELRMNGRAGRGFIKVHGRFWDPRAAMGSFEGVLANQKARGVWSVTRR